MLTFVLSILDNFAQIYFGSGSPLWPNHTTDADKAIYLPANCTISVRSIKKQNIFVGPHRGVQVGARERKAIHSIFHFLELLCVEFFFLTQLGVVECAHLCCVLFAALRWNLKRNIFMFFHSNTRRPGLGPFFIDFCDFTMAANINRFWNCAYRVREVKNVK